MNRLFIYEIAGLVLLLVLEALAVTTCIGVAIMWVAFLTGAA